MSDNNQPDRKTYIGGRQHKTIPGLNEGVVRHLYHDLNMTQLEIASTLSTTQRTVHVFMRRCGIQVRIAAKRNQRGELNDTWKGEAITYKAAHQRVYANRGRPQQCEKCGTSDPIKKYEWANLTGNFHDPADYERLCRSCHCKRDRLIKNLGHYAKPERQR